MKKKTVLMFVFDGYADWELAFVTTGIVMSNQFNLRTIALERTPVTTMGGIRVIPDVDYRPAVDLKDMDASNTAMLLLPGGRTWEENANATIASLILHCAEQGIPIAGICGATIMLAKLGLLDRREHTSNSVDYLSYFSHYQGNDRYIDSPAVVQDKIITGGGTAGVEFAELIFDVLGIGLDESVTRWFRYFQNKTVHFECQS